jgi:putative transposase
MVEADDRDALSAFLRGIGIRVAQGLNRLLSRRGRVLADRFHARALRTPLEVNRVLSYMFGNFRKHAGETGRMMVGVLDACSSAAWFDGWARPDAVTAALGLSSLVRTRPPVAAARTWLLRVGFRRHGLVDPDAVPGRGIDPRRDTSAPSTSATSRRRASDRAAESARVTPIDEFENARAPSRPRSRRDE